MVPWPRVHPVRNRRGDPRRGSGDGGLAFWFLSLCGGGALILIGTFVVTQRRWLSSTLVAVGCAAGSIATMWTLILPMLALALLVLTMLRPSAAEDSSSVEAEPFR